MEKRSARLWLALGLLATMLVSELPFVLTLAKTGWSTLPPVVDYPADQMLYLNFAVIQHSSATELINPWYGEKVPTADVPHLRFPITFRMYDMLRRLLDSWTGAMLAWMAIWSGLTFLAAVFCLRSIAPELDRAYAVVFAFALLVLRSPLAYAAALAHLPSFRTFLDLTLPYERFAFPQVALPAFLAFWGFLAIALRTRRWQPLVWMAFLQFFACISFPYIVPVMAVATVATLLIAKARPREQSPSILQIAALGGMCVVLDGLYLLFTGVAHSRGNVKMALEFHPEQIVPALRPYVFLLFAVAVLAMFARISFAGRATAVGAAIASGILGFANVVFPQESLMLIHFNYVNALSTWLPLLVFAAGVLTIQSRRLLPLISTALLILALGEAYANYAGSLQSNELQQAALREVDKLGLSSTDAVLAPANMSDDISCWIPLISPAKVVFTRDAENLLTADRIYGEQAVRQAFYLKVTGSTYESLSSLTAPGNTRPIPGSYTLFGEEEYLASPLVADRLRGRSLLRQRLLPAMAELQTNPAIAQRVFFGADRVVVIDDDRNPNFVTSALAKWLDITTEKHENGIRVLIGKPKIAPPRWHSHRSVDHPIVGQRRYRFSHRCRPMNLSSHSAECGTVPSLFVRSQPTTYFGRNNASVASLHFVGSSRLSTLVERGRWAFLG